MLFKSNQNIKRIMFYIIILLGTNVYSKDIKYKNGLDNIFIVTTKDTTVGEVDALYYKHVNVTNNHTIKECILTIDNAELIKGYVFIDELSLEMFIKNDNGLFNFKIIEEGDTTETSIVLDQIAYSLNFVDVIIPYLQILNEKSTEIKLYNDSPMIVSKVGKFVIHDMIVENEGNDIIKTQNEEYLCHKVLLKAKGFLISKMMPKIHYWYDIKTNDLIKTQVKDNYKIITK